MNLTSGRFSFISQDSRDRIFMPKDKQISNALGLDWKRLQIPGAEVKKCYQGRLKPSNRDLPRTGRPTSSALVLSL
jgi:hypothetical protein